LKIKLKLVIVYKTCNNGMELPHDVLLIVRDFSRPLTRPDWRTLHLMPSDIFHLDFTFTFNATFNLALILFLQTQTSDYVYTLHEGTIQQFITPEKRCYYIRN